MRVLPLVIEPIVSVSGSIIAQHVSPAPTSRPTSSIAVACSSATPAPAVASAVTSCRTRRARLTGASYELFEVDAQRGLAAPSHREPWGKAYYLLHGRLLVQVGDEGFDLAPGASIAIPSGALNTLRCSRRQPGSSW